MTSTTTSELTENLEPYLGISNSIMGKLWVLRNNDESLALAISRRYGLSKMISKIIAGRGLNLIDVEKFLEPKLRDWLPDPNSLKDMTVAAQRLAKAIKAREGIAIFGDYDVDGATSSALLYRFFSELGVVPIIYIPDRLTEGYGPTHKAFDSLKSAGARVVITVDCGATAYDPINYASSLGLDVIIADHHVGEARSPSALALINPNRLDEDGSLGHLAAVGVSFLLAVAINRELRNCGWYSRNQKEPNVMEFLDLVALGTVCDVVPLTGVNRALVSQGLEVMRYRHNVGIASLIDVTGINSDPNAYHAGFILGPRVNAGGRIGASDLGSKLLCTQNKNEAFIIATKLNELNLQRQKIEKVVLDAATEVVKTAKNKGSSLIFVGRDGWHPGIIGIVASRLVEQFNKPVCVVSCDPESGVCIGSGRSIPGVNLGRAILAARQKGFLLSGGGHPMAAGFKFKKNQMSELEVCLEDEVNQNFKNLTLRPKTQLDGSIQVSGVTLDFIDKLNRLAPFGCGNPEPRFVIPDAKIDFATRAGETHVRCNIKNDMGGYLNAIAFKSFDGPLGKALMNHDGAPFHLVGKLRKNSWQGRENPQILIEDAAPVWGIVNE